MPLYVQNGNLLNKNGTLGTSVGCCCKKSGPSECAGQCSGSNVPSTITFTISNFAGLAFDLFDPNGSYVLPNAYATYGDCYYYGDRFYPFTPFCDFPYSFIGEAHWADILVYPNNVQVKLSERVSGVCVGDRQVFTLTSWATTLCGRPTGFPITGTATTATAYYGFMSFDWSIDL